MLIFPCYLAATVTSEQRLPIFLGCLAVAALNPAEWPVVRRCNSSSTRNFLKIDFSAAVPAFFIEVLSENTGDPKLPIPTSAPQNNDDTLRQWIGSHKCAKHRRPDFRFERGGPLAMFFNKLPWHPLPDSQHAPGRRIAYSGKTRPSNTREAAILYAAAIVDSIEYVKLREIELSGISYYIG